VIAPPADSTFVPEENIIVGNVVLYGATSGEAFFRGRAAERFAVRNSGAHAVIEGVGDHGCEYMTGGRVVILGETGRNFAAGMSGGVAYVWDPENIFLQNVNLDSVELERLEADDDIAQLHELIQRHRALTRSTVAQQILDAWPSALEQFRKVMPIDYKRVLQERRARETAAPAPLMGVAAHG
jgi:glutamate synthase (NADPH/NADH) large chain